MGATRIRTNGINQNVKCEQGATDGAAEALRTRTEKRGPIWWRNDPSRVSYDALTLASLRSAAKEDALVEKPISRKELRNAVSCGKGHHWAWGRLVLHYWASYPCPRRGGNNWQTCSDILS